MRYFCAILVLFGGFRLWADEVIPPAPAAYFNDYAQVVSAGTAEQLNRTLEDFERKTSEQLLVAVYPRMQSDSSVEDYTVRVARAWQVGLKDKNNGAVLFVFVQDHRMFLQTGYGLEGVLPDALCKRIVDEQIAPRFKAGDFEGGLTAGVHSMIAAAQGEYKGNGRTVGDGKVIHVPPWIIILIVLAIIEFLWLMRSRTFRSFLSEAVLYSGGGWSGGRSSGGWGGGGGGGGFSGGGGSFGGGGAGGSW